MLSLRAKVEKRLDWSLALLALVYCVGVQLNNGFVFRGTNTPAWWLTSGVGVACVYLRGFRSVPLVAIGNLVANLFLFRHLGVEWQSTGVGAFLLACTNTGEAALGGWLWRRSESEVVRWERPLQIPFAAPIRVFWFALFVAVLSLLASLVNPHELIAGAWKQNIHFDWHWWGWWLADLTGILVVAPCVVIWVLPPDPKSARGPWWEALLLGASLLVACSAVFKVWSPFSLVPYPFIYALLWFPVWAAFRFGLRGATLTTLVAALVAVWATTHGYGPLVRSNPQERVLLLHAFLALMTLTMLTVSAALAECEESENSLREGWKELDTGIEEENADLKEALNGLAAANEQLRALEKLRDDLNHLLVHDLRTPLTAVSMGLLALPHMGELTHEQQSTVGMLAHSSEWAMQMVNDLLDISLQENGKLQLAHEMVSPEEIVNDAILQITPLAQQKAICLQTQLANDLHGFKGDSEKLKRVIVNLLGNAIKFTPRSGIITLCAERVTFPGKMHSRVWGTRFRVCDTGQGIPPEAFDRIFEKFGQVNTGASTRYSTGLGLTFCKMIVEAHYGRIWVESQVGQGSTFSFIIPHQRALVEEHPS